MLSCFQQRHVYFIQTSKNLGLKSLSVIDLRYKTSLLWNKPVLSSQFISQYPKWSHFVGLRNDCILWHAIHEVGCSSTSFLMAYFIRVRRHSRPNYSRWWHIMQLLHLIETDLLHIKIFHAVNLYKSDVKRQNTRRLDHSMAPNK